jgi:hypothetical protein
VHHDEPARKDALCGCQFANSEEVMQLKTFFVECIRKLVDQSNKCGEKLGDYVKKWYYICSCLHFVE